MEITMITKEELKELLRDTLQEHEERKKKSEIPRLYTINQVAKKLGKAHATIKKYVERGLLRTTKTGEIPEDAIEELLERSL